jgi:hypothetical protein
MSQDSSQELEEDRVTWQSRHVEEVPTFALQDESQEEEELLPTQTQPPTAPPRRRGARAAAPSQAPAPSATAPAPPAAKAETPRDAVAATPRPGGRTPGGAATSKFPARPRSLFGSGGSAAPAASASKAVFDLRARRVSRGGGARRVRTEPSCRPSRWAPSSGRRALSPAPTSGAVLQKRREATLSKQRPPTSARRVAAGGGSGSGARSDARRSPLSPPGAPSAWVSFRPSFLGAAASPPASSGSGPPKKKAKKAAPRKSKSTEPSLLEDLQAVRRSREGAAHRLRSGEYAFGANSYGDPRTAAAAHVDVTVVRDVAADGSGLVASLAYAHRARVADASGAPPGLDASLPRACFVWILLHASTRRALDVAPGAALRVYDPFVAPSSTVPLVPDPANVAAVTILDAQLCEREPTGDLGDAPPAPDGAPDALDAGPPLRVALR